MATRRHHRKRNSEYYDRRSERRRMLDETFYDRERCGSVATDAYELLIIIRGEALFDSRSFRTPSLDIFP